MTPRKTNFKLIYEGTDITTDISNHLLSITYTDNESGNADDLNIQLEDRDGKWINNWAPTKGDKVKYIVSGFDCGLFEIDDISFNGPPSTLTLKAMSVPLVSCIHKNERKNKAWEEVKFSTICKDISSSGGVSVDFQSSEDPELERADQENQTDLEFLTELCNSEQLVIKMIKNKIVILSPIDLEAMGPVATISRAGSNILSYGFNTKLNEIYASCEIEYFDSQKNETIKGKFKASNSTKKDILRLNTQVKDEAEAEKLAKKSLREKNKDEYTGDLSLMGRVDLFTGATILTSGFGMFSRKYIIESLKHNLSNSGFTTDITIRGCLEGY